MYTWKREWRIDETTVGLYHGLFSGLARMKYCTYVFFIAVKNKQKITDEKQNKFNWNIVGECDGHRDPRWPTAVIYLCRSKRIRRWVKRYLMGGLNRSCIVFDSVCVRSDIIQQIRAAALTNENLIESDLCCCCWSANVHASGWSVSYNNQFKRLAPDG